MIARNVLLVLTVVVLLWSSGEACECSDVDCSGQTDIADIVTLVNYMFDNGPTLPFWPAADCTGDGSIDIADLVCWIGYHFGGTIPPTCGYSLMGPGEPFTSGCLDSMPSPNPYDRSAGTLRTEAKGDTLTVFHDQAWYQCCLGYHVEYVLVGDNEIWAIESDVNPECDCYCSFDLWSESNGYENGTYVITLIGIEGDTVGTDTVLFDYPVLTDQTQGPCVMKTDKRTALSDSGVVVYVWTGGTLQMSHPGAVFNCNFELGMSFWIEGDTLNFLEENVSPDPPMYCFCSYDITATVEGIEAGTYVLRVFAKDWDDEVMRLVDEQTLTF